MSTTEIIERGNILFRYRGIFLSIVLILFFTLEINNPYKLLTLYNFSFGVIISFFGFLFRCTTIGYIYNNTSGRNTFDGQIAAKLNIYGMYSIVRNPIYLSNFFIILGIFIALGISIFTILLSLIIFLFYKNIISAEEFFLKNKFGNNYSNWVSKTNVIIPNIFNYNKSTLNFSFLRILNREYGTACALALIYLVIYYINNDLVYGLLFINYYLIFFIVFIYLIMRFLIKIFL
tara:strand:+ start:342 stop:1040 length:699 start_codon:yes stop_codon:yes gene_type:complete